MGIKRRLYFFGQTPLEGVTHVPLQTTRYIDPHIDLDLYDFIIVTSKRSIKAMHSFSYDFKQIPLYCIGEKTAEYAKKHGLHVVYISKGYAKELISEIMSSIKGLKGIYLRPKKVANDFIHSEVNKATFDEAICYETLCIEHTDCTIIRPAIFLFAAPSQVNCFMKNFRFEMGDKAVAIGQTTLDSIPKEVTSFVCDDTDMRSLVKKGEMLQ